ncbi:hypothetical protein LWI28_019859 [Acer negundo]|uniref:Alpha/beta hydrolase fold-3 domain-containing protein n=1 Tax=Acer negundo TaxID=4023 RepID=A0AAD5NV47_ACENE|nr:hypothetical protein LWI28_019859 [Acer negundo]KAK4848159.1 hypothetical protein QYF36_009878 [Acer negundo]
MADSTNTAEVAHDLFPFLRMFKDGRVERYMGVDTVPPSHDPKTSVESKDVIISLETGQSARVYLPTKLQSPSPNKKLPLLVYFHGGGFCFETAFSPTYHNYLNTLVSESRVVAVSVEYRRAPEDPLPAAYDDSWTALKWVASHSNGNGPEDWLNRLADLGNVCFAGDSAGGNIAYHMGMRYGQEDLEGVEVSGIVLIHPYFWGSEAIGSEAKESVKSSLMEKLWRFAYPKTSGCDDPWINPVADPNIAGLGCSRVLVCVGGKDLLRDRGWLYYEKLKESGWRGVVEIMESKDEDHIFHLIKPTSENAEAMLKKIVSFINQDKA